MWVKRVWWYKLHDILVEWGLLLIHLEEKTFGPFVQKQTKKTNSDLFSNIRYWFLQFALKTTMVLLWIRRFDKKINEWITKPKKKIENNPKATPLCALDDQWLTSSKDWPSFLLTLYSISYLTAIWLQQYWNVCAFSVTA